MGSIRKFPSSLFAVNEPMRTRGHPNALSVQILAAAEREPGAASLFWHLVGDLAADVLLDHVADPVVATDITVRRRIAA
jgi:hypothetical protein